MSCDLRELLLSKLLFLLSWCTPHGLFRERHKFGGLGARTDAQAQSTSVPHDIIRFSPKSKDRIFEVCQPFYHSGCSLREIEEKTGFAKTSIREALTSRGYTLRRATKGPRQKSQRSAQMRSPVLPYGYDWLDGNLVVDPKEYRVVQKILQLWRDGKSERLIADFLNQQNIPTRLGKRWFHSSVNSVIKRETKPTGDSNGNQ